MHLLYLIKDGDYKQEIDIQVLIGPRRKKTCLGGLPTTKAQTSLRIRSVWSASLLFPFCKVLYLNLL